MLKCTHTMGPEALGKSEFRANPKSCSRSEHRTLNTTQGGRSCFFPSWSLCDFSQTETASCSCLNLSLVKSQNPRLGWAGRDLKNHPWKFQSLPGVTELLQPSAPGPLGTRSGGTWPRDGSHIRRAGLHGNWPQNLSLNWRCLFARLNNFPSAPKRPQLRSSSAETSAESNLQTRPTRVFCKEFFPFEVKQLSSVSLTGRSLKTQAANARRGNEWGQSLKSFGYHKSGICLRLSEA